jgi:hypothetical protein
VLWLFPPPSNERAFSVDDVDFFLLKLHDMGCSWTLGEVLEQLLQSLLRALSFPFNLAGLASETAACNLQDLKSPCCLAYSRRSR